VVEQERLRLAIRGQALVLLAHPPVLVVGQALRHR